MVQKHFKPWAFIIPGIVIGILILGVPLAQAFRHSLYQIRLYRLGSQTFIGLKNYIQLWNDPLFMMSVRSTIVFTLGCTVLSVVFGLFIASIMSSRGIRGTRAARVFMAFYLIPFVATQVVVGMLGRLFIWEPEYGLVNFLLAFIGIDGPGWLIQTETAMLATIITNTWRVTPLALLVFYAALATIPDELVESAEVDGAKIWTLFTKIKLPMIRYHIGFVSLIIMTSAFREFDVIFTLTGGGPGRRTNVLSMLVYNMGVSTGNMGVANAISFSMFLMIAVIAVVYMKISRLGELGNE